MVAMDTWFRGMIQVFLLHTLTNHLDKVLCSLTNGVWLLGRYRWGSVVAMDTLF